ncbi:MAG: MFS transporter [Betaproteobacteria bacterium]|nr:MFS transporter [Betaproteobacteria bacterium]
METDLPGRLDRLPAGRFHALVIVALGITWLLDGLEVTLAGSVAGVLKEPAALGLTNTDVGLASSAYVAGAVLGALVFGWLTDRIGRRKLFFVTLAVYIAATGATAVAWDFWSFLAFRFLTGAGIGGEYAAINSTIQEFMPPKFRGWIDLGINGTFWVGAALGAVGSVWLLDPAVLPIDTGWRVCFLIGATLALVILLMRAWIPESPRWLLLHGHEARAKSIVDAIETRYHERAIPLPEPDAPRLRLRPRRGTSLREVAHTLLRRYRSRSLVALSLMTAQAFFYNAIFFTYALVLTDFYGVAVDRVGWYLLPFALGNFAGPLVLGRLFDVLGRKVMIAFTYAMSGVLLTLSGYLFHLGLLDSRTQTAAWMIIFFFASAAASSAYLTVSENFPVEIRALTIATFYAFGTALGGIAGPVLFGHLIDTGERDAVFVGYLVGSALMVAAAIVVLRWGTAAERRPLESVATPLSALATHADTPSESRNGQKSSGRA